MPSQTDHTPNIKQNITSYYTDNTVLEQDAK